MGHGPIIELNASRIRSRCANNTVVKFWWWRMVFKTSNFILRKELGCWGKYMDRTCKWKMEAVSPHPSGVPKHWRISKWSSVLELSRRMQLYILPAYVRTVGLSYRTVFLVPLSLLSFSIFVLSHLFRPPTFIPSCLRQRGPKQCCDTFCRGIWPAFRHRIRLDHEIGYLSVVTITHICNKMIGLKPFVQFQQLQLDHECWQVLDTLGLGAWLIQYVFVMTESEPNLRLLA